MFAELDVFTTNYTLVDADIFQLWTEGYSCEWNDPVSGELLLFSSCSVWWYEGLQVIPI